MSLVLSEGINPDIDRVILDRAEYERLRSINAELLKALHMIVHATGPTPENDGGYHEAAYDLAMTAIERAKA